jgi:ribosomal protein L40E
MIKCTECGVQNTSDSNYCRRCGTHLDAVREKDETTERHGVSEHARSAEPVDYLPASGTVLQIRFPGDRDGEFVALQGEVITIGRSPQSDLFLDDVTVSRRHARVVMDLEGFTIEDEGSLNGTYVNRRRIESHRLFDGDEVQVGKFKLTFLEQKSEG